MKSFAIVETNKKAIRDKGWNPLNYNCLLHPDIIRYDNDNDKVLLTTTIQQLQSTTNSTTSTFQLPASSSSSGTATTSLNVIQPNDIIEFQQQNEKEESKKLIRKLRCTDCQGL